jgi:hypothetical protein
MAQGVKIAKQAPQSQWRRLRGFIMCCAPGTHVNASVATLVMAMIMTQSPTF